MSRALVTTCMLAACGSHASVTADAPERATLDSLSAVCSDSPTLTGQHVLSLLSPQYDATYTPTGGVATSLSLVTTYDNGAILCIPAVDNPADSAAASISLTITLELATGDGTFDESLSATVALTEGIDDTSLSLNAYEAIADLHGTFIPVIAGMWDTHFVAFIGQLIAGTTQPAATNGLAREVAASISDTDQVQQVGTWQ
jgi:hypothetical protein